MILKHTMLLLLIANICTAQNGKLLSKRAVALSKTPVWPTISQGNIYRSHFKHLDSLAFSFITYESDNLPITGIMIEPTKKGKYPVVIFNRGGNRDFGRLTVAMMIKYVSKLAAQGFVVIASNYRTNDEFGGSDLNDVLVLTETIKEIESADPSSIGMYGWSRGGMMTYLALKSSTQIQTAIVGNGPTNLIDLIAERPEMETDVLAECVPEYYKNKDSELTKRSVVDWADQLNKNSSLLILCGSNDDRVNPKQSYQIQEKLHKLKYNSELIELDTDHYFSDKQTELNQIVISWFNANLKYQK